MSPLDDELRAALHGRAQAVSPSPDPLAGIERRARRMRRNRTAAAVTSSALAVALVAVAVPAVQSAVAPQRDVPTVAASDGPTTAPSAQPGPDASRYALDPLDPWPYRGVPLEQLGTGTVETVEREYAARRGGGPIELTPLFGQVDEPSQRTELVFLAEVPGADGAPRYFWGVARSSESGPEFPWDEELSEPALALAAALPGDEGVQRLLVVAAPSVGGAVYAADGSSYAPMADVEAGVSVTPVAPGDRDDRYAVLDGDGDLDDPVVEADAPDLAPSG